MAKAKAGRKLAQFAYVGVPIDEEYEGWSNSATWCFNLYFFQEKKNVDDFSKLVQKIADDKEFISLPRARSLFDYAQRHGKMEQIDDDCEGFVNVKEIVDFWLAERAQPDTE